MRPEQFLNNLIDNFDSLSDCYDNNQHESLSRLIKKEKEVYEDIKQCLINTANNMVFEPVEGKWIQCEDKNNVEDLNKRILHDKLVSLKAHAHFPWEPHTIAGKAGLVSAQSSFVVDFNGFGPQTDINKELLSMIEQLVDIAIKYTRYE